VQLVIVFFLYLLAIETKLVINALIRRNIMRAYNDIKSIIGEKISEFLRVFFRNGFFLVATLLFATSKIASNLAYGARMSTALRSGILGLLMYAVGLLIIHFLSTHEIDVSEFDIENHHIIKVFASVLIAFFFITIAVLNKAGTISFTIPVWNELNVAWSVIVKLLVTNSPYITGTGLFGWPYLLIYIALPAALLWRKRVWLPKIFSKKIATAALPFVLAYTLHFVVTVGISIKSILTLMFVIIWPSLGEEYLFRGVLQRTLIKVTSNPVTGIVLMSMIFAITHIPGYALQYVSGSHLLLISSLASVMMTSIFWGYGYYRTGVLWPWILLHALSNLTGI